MHLAFHKLHATWDRHLHLPKVDYSRKSGTVTVAVQVYLGQRFNASPITLARHKLLFFFFLRYRVCYSDSIYVNLDSVELSLTLSYAWMKLI